MTKLLDLDSQRRNAILNAALKEFSSQGYDNASTNVIAKEAGISKALMFHYVSSKQELFLVVYDYFSDLLKKGYFELMNYEEIDIFDRLRQSYLLQIKLLEKYPWILEFNKLSRTTNSNEINEELENRISKEHSSCYPKLFDEIDEAKFRKELDIEKCKQLILWSNIGFTNEILDDIRNSESPALNYDLVVEKLDGYFDELRKVFYTSKNE
ncbi:TetR/AcrR family transcriptional regulator [Bacillus paramycoides]|uniref:TetR/AcrR family transcriptional regulator n=1 Tax=Bacillus paramycoides TaxID=2026194 RepID=UPI002243032A|nr:TetR/AcrR family transcriptional regulator [Bacillus paramycoides]MCW9134679.1 TetR/AcrR family transcriptional regulator [Bacillus paramycoides]